MAAIALLAMSACNNEIDEPVAATKGKAVSFQMGLASTRTATGTDYVTTFVKGDAVGIFAYERNADGTDGALAVTNAKYVLNDTGISWEAADANNTAYADSKKAFNYYAYYPYQEGVTKPGSVQMAVKPNQSTAAAADYNISDALTAQNKTVAANSTDVALQFIHAFALVQVNLEGTMADKDATITMQNVYLGAALNLQYTSESLPAGSTYGEKGTIKMYSLPEVNEVADADRFAFRAIVPAQSIGANDALLEIKSKGKTYRFTYSTAVSYKAGKLRVMNVTLGETAGKTTITIPAANMSVDIWGTTEAETGSGSVEEAPLISKFGTELTPIVETPLSLTTDTWFALTGKGIANLTYSIEDDANVTWGKAAKLEYKDAGNSWYKSAIGYYHTTPLDVSATSVYKVTLKIKAAKNGAGLVISKLTFTCRNAANTHSFQVSANANFTGSEATSVTKAPAAENTWESFAIYINLAKKSTAVGTTALIDADATDYSKIDFRAYTGAEAGSTIYISDVVLEPYIAVP